MISRNNVTLVLAFFCFLLSVKSFAVPLLDGDSYEVLENPPRHNEQQAAYRIRIPVSIAHSDACADCLSFDISQAMLYAINHNVGSVTTTEGAVLTGKSTEQYLTEGVLKRAYLLLLSTKTVLSHKHSAVALEYKDIKQRQLDVNQHVVAEVFTGDKSRRKLVLSHVNEGVDTEQQWIDVTFAVNQWLTDKKSLFVLDLPSTRSHLQHSTQRLTQYAAYLELTLSSDRKRLRKVVPPPYASHTASTADVALNSSPLLEGKGVEEAKGVEEKKGVEPQEDDKRKKQLAAGLGAWVAISALSESKRSVGEVGKGVESIEGETEKLEQATLVDDILPVASIGGKAEKTPRRAAESRLLKSMLGVFSVKSLFGRKDRESKHSIPENFSCAKGEVLTGFTQRSKPVCQTLEGLLQDQETQTKRVHKPITEPMLMSISKGIAERFHEHITFDQSSPYIDFGEAIMSLATLKLAPMDVNIMDQHALGDNQYQLKLHIPQMQIVDLGLVNASQRSNTRVDVEATSSAWNVELDLFVTLNHERKSKVRISVKDLVFTKGIFQNFNMFGEALGPIESQSLWLALKKNLSDVLAFEYVYAG